MFVIVLTVLLPSREVGQEQQRFAESHHSQAGLQTLKKVAHSAGLALLALFLLDLAGSTQGLLGQAFVNGAITVVVSDSSGAVLPNTSLTLTNLGTTATLTETSDSTGTARFVNLPPGDYRLQANHTGFTRIVQAPIVVEVNNTVRIPLTLQLGSVIQQVQVAGEELELQPETSSLGQVIQQRATTELPLNGRNPIALVELVPGVIPQGGAGESPVMGNSFQQGDFQISGAPANMSGAYWDGVPMNSVGYLNELAIVPTQDSLQEFKVQTSDLPAEYDRFAGGIVSFVSKTGTNNFHGEAYGFLRNKVLNANNFFNNREGIANPQFTQNQFGGNLGGYIRKNKLFFFGSYDGFRIRQGAPYLLTVPTLAERGGDFSNLLDSSGHLVPIYDPTTTTKTNGTYTRTQFHNNIIPSSSLDPTALILEEFWPSPNLPGTITGANNWAGNESSGGNMDEYIGRGDYNISERQKAFVRYTYEKWNRIEDNVFGTGVNISADQSGQGPNSNVIQQVALDDTITFSPHLVGDFEIGFLRASLVVAPDRAGFDLSTLGPGWSTLPAQTNIGAPPAINMSQVTGWQTATDMVINEHGDDYTFLPSIDWMKGHHSIKFGGEFQLSDLNYEQGDGLDGSFSFSSNYTNSGPTTATGGFDVASFVLGDVDAGNLVTMDMPAAKKFYYALYGQDDWQVTRSLTLNIGLRYSYDSAYTERHNWISTFEPNQPNADASESGLSLNGQMALVNTPQRPSRSGFDAFRGAFAPRFGFGYQVNGKTTIRGAYGVFWPPAILSYNGTLPVADPINEYSNSMVASLDGGLTPKDHLSNPFPSGILPPPRRATDINSYFDGQTPNGQYPTDPYPYVQQWNLDIQRELPWRLFADVAYEGTKGTHLGVTQGYQIDQLPPQYMSEGTALLNEEPNPFYNLPTPFTGILAGPTIPAGQLLRPYPQYNGLLMSDNIGATSYNAFQLKLHRNFSSGQTILLAYTKSKSLSDGVESQTQWLNGVAGIQNYDNLRGEWGLVSYDVSQRMVVSYVLNLPVGKGKRFLSSAHGVEGAIVSGWGSDAIWTAQTGFPLGFNTATNLTGSLGGGSRPNYDIDACPHGAGGSGSKYERVAKWFNTACFTQPAPYTFGDVSRTSGQLRSDGTDTIDFALFKDMPFLESGAKLQFRAEAFNLVNTPVFAAPDTSLGSAGYGLVTEQSNNPRLIQFGLKLSF
jgi:hypothetical protein